MGWWSELRVREAASWAAVELGPDQAAPELARGEVEPDTAYVHLWLRSMRLSYGRKWTQTYHGSLTSYARTEHAGGQPAEFLLALSPDTLRGITKADAARVAIGQTRLAGPVPYRGGGLEVELGLFAIPAADLAAPYLDLLSAVGDVAGGSFVGAAMAVLGPVKKGLSDLVGLADVRLEIGVRRTFAPLHTGVFAVFAASRDQLGDRRCVLDGNVLRWADGTEVTDIGHIVFSVETSRSRADWRRLPLVAEAHADLLDAIRGDRLAEVEHRFAHLRRVVLLSPDLTPADADAVLGKVADTLKPIQETTGQRGRFLAPPAFADLDLFPGAEAEPANRAPS